jgi:hypothetical protein
MKEIIIKKTSQIEKNQAIIEKKIREYFYENIFKDILAIFKESLIKNSIYYLESLIETGFLYYKDGAFYGKLTFKAIKELTDLGGKLQGKKLNIEYAKLPKNIKKAIEDYNLRIERIKAKIQSKLEETKVKLSSSLLIEKITFEGEMQGILENIEIQFNHETGLEINPQFSKIGRELMSKEYTQNLKLDVKTWTDEKLLKMRNEVEEKLLSGVRIEKIADYFKEQYQISQRKAEFLASQETRLLYTKYHQQKASSYGLRYFKWRHSRVPKVPRPFHIYLSSLSKDKKIIFDVFNLPKDPQTGEIQMPGEDFGCGCIAIYLVGSLEELQEQGYKIYKVI